MATLKKRLGFSIILAIVSLTSVFFWLLRADVKEMVLQRIGVGEYEGILNWSTEPEGEGKGEGGRIVVFGDHWVAGPIKGEEGGVRSWVGVLCEEMKCSSYYNFAARQAMDAWPAEEPMGSLVSNTISRNANATLPDLAAQIASFLALPAPEQNADETLFVFSFGFWDIYTFASLDKELGENMTDIAVEELFAQLDILYTHFATSLSASDLKPQFRILVPKVLDPSLSPGWLSLRPLPLNPSSIAEEQRNAAYLTERWNLGVENRLDFWLRSSTEVVKSEPGIHKEGVTGFDDASHDTGAGVSADSRRDDHLSELVEIGAEVLKDAFYYDLPSYLLDIMIEHQLEDEGLQDAEGLGIGESPFESVYLPCVREVLEDGDAEEGMKELANGMWECENPEEYLWWDGFGVGSVAMREVAGLVSREKNLGSRLGMDYDDGGV